MGAGILPISFYKGKVYFLFSRESKQIEPTGGRWSDFGGSKENNESNYQTAIREGWEESSGFLGNKKDIKRLINMNLIDTIKIKTHQTYIVQIPYNKNLPKKFREDYLKTKKNHPELINKNGKYEKDMLQWIEYDKIKNYYTNNKFRRWYNNIIKKIINTDYLLA